MSEKNKQYLIEYVTKLKQLNDIEIEIPKVKPEEVIKNPRQYAMDFVEADFVSHFTSFAKAYKLGSDFGKKNK